jgi:hypothetical protein
MFERSYCRMSKSRFDIIERYGLPDRETLEGVLAACVPKGFGREPQIRAILECCLREPALFPNIRGKIGTSKEYAQRWVLSFVNGFQNRRSQSSARSLGTVADPIVDVIVSKGLELAKAPESLVGPIREGHRISMVVENIVGELLEEYIESNTIVDGWAMAWGQTMKSIDFFHSEFGLLQVKNRSNSENSSSSAVRVGTKILKWHRIDASNGHTNWEELNQLMAKPHKMSEQGFKDFVTNIIHQNPSLAPPLVPLIKELFDNKFIKKIDEAKETEQLGFFSPSQVSPS